MLDKVREHTEGLRLKRHRHAASAQLVTVGVELEVLEAIDHARPRGQITATEGGDPGLRHHISSSSATVPRAVLKPRHHPAPSVPGKDPARPTGASMATDELASGGVARVGGESRAAALAGARDIAPVLVALAPVAITLGATLGDLHVDSRVTWAGGALVYGASPYLTAVSLLAAGASGLSVVLAVLVLTSRGVIYSAALLSRMRGQPAWFRWAGPYLLVDPLFALVVSRTDERDPSEWVRWYYLGAGLAIWLVWMPSLAIGLLAGPVLTRNSGLDVALTALLIAFLVPGLRSRPALVAAATGVAVGAAASALPGGAGLALATLAGTLAADATERAVR